MPLDEDVTIAGPITRELHVSTTGTDSRLGREADRRLLGRLTPIPIRTASGVQMGGYQQLVRGEVMRGKFRDSFEKPEPFEPGKLDEASNYVMPDAYHTFRRGHRIMIHVQSSWFPLVDRNPQKFCDIYSAGEEDFQKATHAYTETRRPTPRFG